VIFWGSDMGKRRTTVLSSGTMVGCRGRCSSSIIINRRSLMKYVMQSFGLVFSTGFGCGCILSLYGLLAPFRNDVLLLYWSCRYFNFTPFAPQMMLARHSKRRKTQPRSSLPVEPHPTYASCSFAWARAFSSNFCCLRLCRSGVAATSAATLLARICNVILPRVSVGVRVRVSVGLGLEEGLQLGKGKGNG
jgi:hypothetical protein